MMWRIVRTEMWSRKRRLLSTTTAVLLGVAFLTASLAVGSTLTAGFDDLFEEANAGTDVVVRNSTQIGSGDFSSRGRLDDGLLDDLADVEGVAAVSPVIEGTGRIVGADGDDLGGDGPPTLAGNWIAEPSVNPWALAEGRAPLDVAADRPYEVVIDRAAAADGGLSIGDRTVVEVPRPVDVTIVGLATFGGADSLGPTTWAAFTDDAARDLFGAPDEVSAFRIAATDGIGQQALRDAVGAVLPAEAEALTGAELTDEMMADIEGDFLGLFRTILVAFAAVAVVVAAFSIHNTFSILVAQRTRESALLRAIGASRRQVLVSVVVEAALIGLLAAVAGLVAGYGLALALKSMLDGAGMDLGIDGVIMSSSTVVAAVVVGVGTTLVASIVPAIRSSRVSPLAALRESAVDQSATSRARAVIATLMVAAGTAVVVTATSADDPLTRAGLGALVALVGAVVLGPIVARPAAGVLGWLVALVRGQTGRLARRNAMRDPRRTAGSAAALMIGTAVVALFATFAASIKSSVENTVDRDFGGDLIVVPDDFSGADLDPSLAEQVGALPEVERAAGMSIGIATIDGESPQPSVIDPQDLDRLLDVGVSSGSLDDVVPGTVAMSEIYAEEHELGIGSPIEVAYADGTSQDMHVAALYESTMTLGHVLMTPEDWNPHAVQLGHVVVLVDLADGVAEARGAAAVDAVAARLGAPEAMTRSEYVDSLGDEIDQMLFFVYGMLGLAVLIALMGIANTLSLSIHERTRELGLLRAVGQTRAQLRSTVRWESVIVSVFGAVGGVGLGTFLGWGLMRALVAQEGFGDLAVPVTSLGVMVVLAAAAGVVAAWRPSRRAARLDVLDAIATD